MLNGKKLKFLRIYKGKKANDLAKYVNKSKNYISMLENEHQAIPGELYEKWLEWLYKTEDKKEQTEKEETK